VHTKSVVGQGFFPRIRTRQKALKSLQEFESVENVRTTNVVEFEFNFVTSLVVVAVAALAVEEEEQMFHLVVTFHSFLSTCFCQ